MNAEEELQLHHSFIRKQYEAVIREFQELVIKKGKTKFLDQYIVSTKPDPYFDHLLRRYPLNPLSEVSITTMINKRYGYSCETESKNLNHHNRRSGSRFF